MEAADGLLAGENKGDEQGGFVPCYNKDRESIEKERREKRERKKGKLKSQPADKMNDVSRIYKNHRDSLFLWLGLAKLPVLSSPSVLEPLCD